MSKIKSFKLRRGTKVDNYQVRECLGRGWEGEVYRVREKLSNGLRVLKLFNPNEFGSDEMKRFCSKFEKLSSVESIIKYYHANKWNERNCYYMVMEYIPGRDLGRLVEKHPFPVFKSLKIVRAIFETICQCHKLKVCLGDIHPGNIVMARNGQVKIIDLDLSNRFNHDGVMGDIISGCKLLYDLNQRSADYPSDLRSIIPLREDAIRNKYQSAAEVLKSISSLMGD